MDELSYRTSFAFIFYYRFFFLSKSVDVRTECTFEQNVIEK